MKNLSGMLNKFNKIKDDVSSKVKGFTDEHSDDIDGLKNKLTKMKDDVSSKVKGFADEHSKKTINAEETSIKAKEADINDDLSKENSKDDNK